MNDSNQTTPETERHRMTRRTNFDSHATVRRLTAGALGAALLFAGPAAATAQEAQEITGSTVLLSTDVARLELELATGETHTIELNDGQVLIDGGRRGAYEPGGAFDRAWRDLLRNPALGETERLGELLAGWEPPAGGAPAAPGASAVLGAFDRYDPAALGAREVAAETAVDAAPDGPGQVTIVPRAGSLGQLADRLRELNETVGRMSGEDFGLEGDFALVVHDDYRIADGTTIRGDVALLGGTLAVEGDIEGDVLVLGGLLRLDPGALVMGDVRSVGGDVETTGATITGEILSLTIPAGVGDRDRDADVRIDGRTEHDADWNYERRGGPGLFGSITRNLSRAFNDLVGTLVWIIALTLLGAGFVYFAPNRLEAVAAEARSDVLRSFGVGLAGQLLVLPILLLLVVLVVTWLVIPFYLVAVAIAVPAGYLAVARGLGEAVVDRRYELFDRFNLNRQNTYYYVLNGIIILLAPFALAAVLQLFGGLLGFLRGLALFLAFVLGWAATTTGLGAVILTRGGGLTHDIPGFRRKRAVPLDDIRQDGPDA